jgi:hypothetical protein
VQEPGPPPSEDLWHLYDVAVEEYRFQVNLNNQRFQWYVTLNAALIAAATGLLRLGDGNDGRPLTAAVFGVGFCLAIFTAIAWHRQRGYYQAARDQVRKLAAELGVAEWSVVTTAGFRGQPSPRWTKVWAMNYALLGVLAAVNAFGVFYALVLADG